MAFGNRSWRGGGCRLPEAQLSRLSSPAPTSLMRPLCLVTIVRGMQRVLAISWIRVLVTNDHSLICNLPKNKVVLACSCSGGSLHSVGATAWTNWHWIKFSPWSGGSQVLTIPHLNPSSSPTTLSSALTRLPCIWFPQQHLSWRSSWLVRGEVPSE